MNLGLTVKESHWEIDSLKIQIRHRFFKRTVMMCMCQHERAWVITVVDRLDSDLLQLLSLKLTFAHLSGTLHFILPYLFTLLLSANIHTWCQTVEPPLQRTVAILLLQRTAQMMYFKHEYDFLHRVFFCLYNLSEQRTFYGCLYGTHFVAELTANPTTCASAKSGLRTRPSTPTGGNLPYALSFLRQTSLLLVSLPRHNRVGS